jgi:hypothetical protein
LKACEFVAKKIQKKPLLQDDLDQQQVQKCMLKWGLQKIKVCVDKG